MILLTKKELTPKTIMFDLDKTLINNKKNITTTINHALLATNRNALPTTIITNYINNDTHILITQTNKLPESDPKIDTLLDRFISYYLEHPIDFTK